MVFALHYQPTLWQFFDGDTVKALPNAVALLSHLAGKNANFRVMVESAKDFGWLNELLLTACNLFRLPIVEHPKKNSVTVLIGENRRFLRLVIWLGSSRMEFYNAENFLRNHDMDAVSLASELDRLDLHGMTISAAAMNDYVQHSGGYQKFAQRFPRMSDGAERAAGRAYSGGLVWAPHCKEYENVVLYDINSLYPSIMRNNPLPFGEPVEYSGAWNPSAEYPLAIRRVVLRADINPGRVPILLDKTRGWGSHVLHTDGLCEMWLTSVEYDAIREHYDTWTFEEIGGYAFHGSQGMFQSWVDEWYSRKQKATGGERMLTKLVLNSITGKFGAVPRTTKLMPTVATDEVVWNPVRTEPRNTMRYTPVAAFITAYGRAIIARHIVKNYDRFIYTDTDSLMIRGEAAETLPVGDGLGEWKVSDTMKKVRILGARKYAYVADDGSEHFCLAGVTLDPDNLPTYKGFKKGAKIPAYGTRITL